jgi:hypothetical protein
MREERAGEGETTDGDDENLLHTIPPDMKLADGDGPGWNGRLPAYYPPVQEGWEAVNP